MKIFPITKRERYPIPRSIISTIPQYAADVIARRGYTKGLCILRQATETWYDANKEVYRAYRIAIARIEEEYAEDSTNPTTDRTYYAAIAQITEE